MADVSIVAGTIEQIKTDGTIYAIAASAYGECNTAANEQNKTVAMTGFKLTTGVTIHIKFINTNTTNTPTLNVNGTGAKSLIQYTGQAINAANSWHAGAILTLTYDGANWIRNEESNSIIFDGSSTDKYLSEKGTWETAPKIKIVTWNSVI